MVKSMAAVNKKHSSKSKLKLGQSKKTAQLTITDFRMHAQTPKYSMGRENNYAYAPHTTKNASKNYGQKNSESGEQGFTKMTSFR